MNRLVRSISSICSKLLASLRLVAVSAAVLGLSFGTVPLYAADIVWLGTGGGGDGVSWDDSDNWQGGMVPGAGDVAIFPANASGNTTGDIVLPANATADSIEFEGTSYVLSGNNIILSGNAVIDSAFTESATIDSVISGTDGLRVTGGGTIRLNGNNTYTGTTNIDYGTVVITDASALGADTSTILINGSSTRGANGGSLVLDGTNGDITITRNINIRGRGPISDRGHSILSFGNNTIQGTVNAIVANNNSRTTSVVGDLTFAGTFSTAGATGTARNQFNDFGGVNDVSVGNYALTGTFTGDGSIAKQGGGVLLLDPSNATFTGRIRINGASFQQSGIRIISENVLGNRTGAGVNESPLDFNGGFLEVLMDSPSILSGGAPANVYQRSNGQILVDHALGTGSQVINQTLTFGNVVFEENRDLVFWGRNGFNVTIGDYTVNGGNANSDIFNRLRGGTLTIDGDFWNNPNTGSRLFRFEDNGNTIITGNILANNAGNKTIEKDGIGVLTVLGNQSTYADIIDLNGGTLAITDFGSIGGSASTQDLRIGDSTLGTGSTELPILHIGTSIAPNAANLTTNRIVELAGTTGDAMIRASQSGNIGVTFNGNFNATGGGTKDLVLTGTNTADNTINGVISNNSGTNLTRLHKDGTGTWVLTGNNTYTGETRIAHGNLKLRGNASNTSVINDSSRIHFLVLNSLEEGFNTGGSLTFMGNDGEDNVELVGSLKASDGSNTVEVISGAGGNATLTFSAIESPENDATINFVTSGAGNSEVTISNYTGSTANIYNAGVFYNGADYAFITGNNTAIRAPIYGTDANFANASTGLTASQNNNITASFTDGGITVNTLRFAGGDHTLTANGTITIQRGANVDGGILVSGSNSTITGADITTGGTGDLIIRVDQSSDFLTLDSNIASNSNGSLIKVGAGTLVIGGNMDNEGQNVFNEGATILKSGASLANRNTQISTGATLDIGGNDVNFRNFQGGGTLLNTGGDVTVTIGNNGGGGTFSGSINETAGVISVVKTGGNGDAQFDGVSNYTGSTTILGTGLLSVQKLANIGEDSSIGRGNVADNAGSLIFSGASASNDLGGINYDGRETVATDRLFTFGGTAANSGAAIYSNGVNAASVVFSNTGELEFTAGAQAVDQTLRLSGGSTGDNTFSPRIVDPSGSTRTHLLKNSTGVWILANSLNAYTGNTTIAGGRLGAVDGSSLPTNSALIIQGGQLLSSGTFSRNLVDSGNITAGVGTITLGNTTNTGFAAHDTKLTVALNPGSGNNVTWGTGGFFEGTGETLLLNSDESMAELDFATNIDLNGATRTVSTDDNAATAGDFVTISGVISGSGNLTKVNAGTLVLSADNSYTGATRVNDGELIVYSLGNSAIAGNSSLGSTVGANTTAGAITLDHNGNNGTSLVYIGAGETSDRLIRLTANDNDNGNAAPRIYASGTGALILTNVDTSQLANGNSNEENRLYLRGNNAGNNMITSDLVDGPGGSNSQDRLNVFVDGSATWILTGNNTHNGKTHLNAGALGVGSDTALGTGPLSMNNGILFAHGADRTITNAIDIDNNTGPGFKGDYSITFSDPVVSKLGNTNWSLNNFITTENGKSLTFQGEIQANALSANRTFTMNGTGTTNILGGVSTSTTRNINITKNWDGVLVLGKADSGNDLNGGVVTLDNGTIRLAESNVFQGNTTDGDTMGVFLFDPESTETATFDLNGNDDTINAVTTQGEGFAVFDNSGSTDSTLTFGANDGAVNISNQTARTTFTDTGTGTLSIVKAGNQTAILDQDVTLTYEGATRVSGGSLIIQTEVQGTNELSVIGTGVELALNGGITNPGNIITVQVDAANSTLDLVNSAGDDLNALTTLSLGASGNVTLDLEAGASNTDTLTIAANAAASSNTVTLNITDLGMLSGNTYNLLSAPGSGGLSGATYVLGTTPSGYDNITLNQTDNLVSITAGNLLTGNVFWNGGVSGNWTGANWSSDKAGTTGTAVPGAGNDVFFIADNFNGSAGVNTTLDQNIRLNSLTFEESTASGNTPGNVTIAGTNRLDIAPTSSTDGIAITTGNITSVTISAPLNIGADQTWNVAHGNSTLTLSGGLQGDANATVAGDGEVNITAAADPGYNSSGNSTIIVGNGSNGTLRLSNSNGLTGLNPATVRVDTGGEFYTSVSTPANPLQLNGGTLGVQGGNRTLSGNVSVTADSSIDAHDHTNASTARNVTLTGDLTGSSSLTINGDADTGTNNQVNGAAFFNGDTSGFTGNISFTSGSVFYNRNTTGVGVQTQGDISFEEGRVIIEGVGGETVNWVDRDITIARAGSLTARGEIQLDRQGSDPGTFIVNNTGTLTLGDADSVGSLRIFLNDGATNGVGNTQYNQSGNITLLNDAIISTRDNINTVATFSGDINGGSFNLTIGDNSWGGTNGVTHLTGNNTYGDTILERTTLRIDDVNAISSGNIDFAGGRISTSANVTLSNNIAETSTDAIYFEGWDDNNLTLTDSFTIGTTRQLRTNGDAFRNTSVKETITFTGAITGADTSGGNKLVLEGNAFGAGILTGGYTQSGTAADVTVNGGEWTFSGNTVTVADNMFVQTNDAILNLDGTGILAFNDGGSQLRVYNGATINLNADNAATNLGQLRVGTDGGNPTNVGTFNTNGFDFGDSTMDLILGLQSPNRIGIITGNGSITSDNVDLYRGSISANLITGAGNANTDKFGTGTVTLSGNNNGWTSTGRFRLVQGGVILDYTNDINQKIANGASSELEMRGGTLTLEGHASSAVNELIGAVGNDQLRLRDGDGHNVMTLNSNGGDLAITFGQIERIATDGTIRFELPSGAQTATNGIITDETNNASSGLLDNELNIAYAVVKDGSEVYFARNATNAANGNIVGLVSTAKDDLSTWAEGDHVTDSAGYFGSIFDANIDSLRFDAAANSTVSIDAGGVLGIESGGILITDDAIAGAQRLVGGKIDSAGNEIVIHNYGAGVFELNSSVRESEALTFTGNGTTLFTGTTTSSGRVSIFGGTLRTAGNLNQLHDVVFSDASDATWELTADESIRRLFGGRTDFQSQVASVVLNGHNLDIDFSGGNTDFAGDFVGNGTVTVSGTSIMTLLGEMTNDFTGDFVVDGGQLKLDLRADARTATSWTVQNGGLLELEKLGNTREGDMIGNSAPVTLISADGALAGSTIIRGFYLDTDQASNNAENIGLLNVAGGTSYISIDAKTGGDDPFIQADNVLRTNHSTLNIRGRDLGNAGGGAQVARVLIDNAQEAGFKSANEIGGGGAIGTTTISIIPWAIGQDLANNVNDLSVGNSFLHYDVANGFRALALGSEYDTFGTAGATSNVREALSGNLSIGAAAGVTTINSLVIDGNATQGLDVSGAGAGESLEITSGGLLFTTSGATASGNTYDTTLGGFDNGITTTSGEYIFHVVNPTSADNTIVTEAIIGSNLTSSANITKSGRGTLNLTGGTNTAGGGSNVTTINEGILLIGDLDNIGGSTGTLNFAGGTLQLNGGFTDDLSTRSLSYLAGTTSTFDNGGNNVTLANSLGSGGGGLIFAGGGNVTLNATSTRTGTTSLTTGEIIAGADNAFGTGELQITGDADLDLGGNNQATDFFVKTGGASTISNGTITSNGGFYFNLDSSTTTVVSANLAGSGGLFKDETGGFGNLELSGNNTYTGQTVFERSTLTYHTLGNVGGGASSLGAPTTVENGTIRLGSNGIQTTMRFVGTGNVSSDRIIAIDTRAHGTPTTSGITLENDSPNNSDLHLGVINNASYGEKALTLQGTSTGASSVAAIRDSLGTLNVRKIEGNSTWSINGDSNYKGTTTVSAGGLFINGDNSQATGNVTVAAAATLGGTGTIGGATDIAGTHVAGTSASTGSAGQQSFSSDLTYSGGAATMSWDLINNSSATPGTDFDQFVIGGALDFAAATSLDLNFDGGMVDWNDSFWDADQTWTIYSGATSLANIGNLSIFSEDWMDSNGVLFSTVRGGPHNSMFTVGASGNNVVLTFTAVPEPSTYALMSLALGAFGWAARRRRKVKSE